MNIEDNARTQYWTNSTTTDSMTTNGSLARSLTSDAYISTDQPGTYNWSSRIFYAVAIPLTFASIILPLVAGHAFRLTARYSIKNRFKFRLVVCSAVWLL